MVRKIKKHLFYLFNQLGIALIAASAVVFNEDVIFKGMLIVGLLFVYTSLLIANNMQELKRDKLERALTLTFAGVYEVMLSLLPNGIVMIYQQTNLSLGVILLVGAISSILFFAQYDILLREFVGKR